MKRKFKGASEKRMKVPLRITESQVSAKENLISEIRRLEKVEIEHSNLKIKLESIPEWKKYCLMLFDIDLFNI